MVGPHIASKVDHVDYDSVAEFYDLYTAVSYDYEFFLSRVAPAMRVLELTSGTGRLSIPLVKAGAVLTCVEVSKGMIKILKQKLENQRLEASVLCADVQHLDFHEQFETAILPFQSFMELVGKKKQLNTLRSVYRALVENGRFYCTMHNPAIRRKTVDGVPREVGTFTDGRGTVMVSGFETGGNPVVRRSQFIERFDKAGSMESRLLQLMEFEMIEYSTFREMAIEAGFEVITVFGDYQAHQFKAETSPVMIWELKKGDA